MEAEPAQVVRHLAGAVLVERAAEELGHGGAHITMSEPAWVEREQTEGLHEGEDAAIAEAQRRCPVGVDDDRLGEGIQVIVTDQAVVAQIIHAEEASVGSEADLPQGGEIAKSPTDLEVVGAVNGRFGAECLAFFVQPLDARLL